MFVIQNLREDLSNEEYASIKTLNNLEISVYS